MKLILGAPADFGQEQSGPASFMEYLKSEPEYLRLHNELANVLAVPPLVAAYALFATHLTSVDAATEFLYDRKEVG